MFGVRAAAVILVCLAASTTVHADTRYQQLRVPYGSPSDREKIFFHPDLELMGEDDGAYIVLSYPELTDQLRNRGIPFEIQYDDLSAHYREIQGPGTRGDFGSWHTYAETVAEMNAFHLQYPNLTTAPFSIGTTGEGRTIWAIKVSDNPTIDEPEPELLFDGVHHAREIMTVEMNLDFMHYLCANYGSDPVVSDIVDHREVFFVPIVNPDGFVYNELTDPAGGGLWRKNRRANAGGCFGVDNNRNYPYQWVGSGSSTDPCNETYRGPAANSEPENQAMVSFINSRHFTIWQSYHSVAGMVLFPWGYTTAHTGDDATFRAIATEMARDSGYQTGQPPEILYNVNGGAFDWGYGDTSQHTKIFAFTTEIGGSGFWPAPSERDPLIAENLHSNLYLCQIAGASLELVSLTVQGGNGRLDPGETAALVVTVRNGGVIVPANNVVATLRCDDPYVQLLDAATSLGNIAGGQQGASTLDPFDLTIASSCPDGRAVTFKVEMRAEDGTTGTGTIVLSVGQSPVIYANDFEEANEAWSTDPTNTATAGTWVRIDPNPTAYQPGDDTTPAPGVNAWITGQNSSEGVDDVDNGVAASRSSVIDLSAHPHVRLDLNYFFGQRDPGDDPSGDFFKLSVSNNGGSTFPVDLLSIGDVVNPAAWTSLTVELDGVIPITSQMVFRVQAADGIATGDIIEGGLDDFLLSDRGDGNDPPSIPVLSSPSDGAGDQPGNLALTVTNSTDPENDVLAYGFRVYGDADLTQLLRSVDGVASGPSTTAWPVSPSLPVGTYYWRAFANDGHSLGLCMNPARFTVGAATAVGDAGAPRAALAAGPNPSRDDVLIRYFATQAPTARLDVFDAMGRRVRTLPSAKWTVGWQEVRWDGKDDAGRRVAAGIYQVRLATPGETRSVRVVRLQ